MADVKISELPALTSPDGAEELVVNDGGITKKITIANAIATALAKAGGAMTGVISNFTSTGIDDNATGTKVTVSDTGTTVVGFIQSDSIGPAPGGLAAPGASLNWYKIGSLALHGAKAGVLTVLGTKDYSGAGTISAESKLTLRGGTVSTTVAGHYSGNSQGSPTAQFAWKNTASGVFDIYASNAQFGNLNSYYKGEGSWNASYSDTGSTSLPTNSTAFASKYGISINGAANFMFDSDGLKFNGDTAAANALDDYETGTWTPQFLDSVGNVIGVTLVTSHYTKVGRAVTLQLYFEVTALRNGYLNTCTLPFSGISSERTSASVSTYNCPVTTNSSAYNSAYIQNSTLSFWRVRNSATSLHMQVTNGAEIIVGVTYFV